MRKLYFLTFFIISAMLSSCGKGGAGELVGAYNKKFKNRTIPLGMVYIPAGRNAIGMTDEDITFFQGKSSKMVSFSAFYMDQTEITNAEYRQFVNWVRDSIAITDYISGGAGGGGGTAGAGGAAQYFKKTKNAPQAGAAAGPKDIDWKKVGNGSKLWAPGKGGKPTGLDAMYHQVSLNGRNLSKGLNTRLIKYSYVIKNLDYEVANPDDPNISNYYDIYSDAAYNGVAGPVKPRNIHPSIKVYPDTLVWKKDFTFEHNDNMVEAYFNHPSYDRYPVVGVNWDQANAFCAWRSQFYESVARARKGTPVNSRLKYMLPTEAEFEYAARGGRTQTKYPWGGPYIQNARGCLQANFKVGRGNYADDGGLYTVEAKAYFPNDYGLYNMSGNVAEWTLDGFNRNAYEDRNSAYKLGRRKIVKGGSWKDMGFFLQNAVSSYELDTASTSYIGFRCVSKYPGNDLQ